MPSRATCSRWSSGSPNSLSKVAVLSTACESGWHNFAPQPAHAFLKEHDGDYVASRTVTFRILSAIVEGWRAADIATLLIETSADFDVSTVGIEVALMRLVDERVEFWNIGGLAVLARKTSGGFAADSCQPPLQDVVNWGAFVQQLAAAGWTT